MSSSYAAAAAGGAGWRPPFTASQWQELEHQALIFKYLVAGVPVPPELLVPILKSFESMAARFYHHPTSLGYCSLYGKKLDPEPWRCRRTDGKKWRCSKNAYPDSKYCERHMHRGRNRSRKPVETTTTPATLSQQPPPTSSPSSSSSTLTTLAPASAGAAAAKISLPCSSATGTGMIPLPSSLGQQLQIGPAGYYYQMAGGDNCRYNNLLLGVKSEVVVDEHNFLSEASAGSAIEASLDNPWQLMPSQLHSGGGSPPRRPQSMQENFDREARSSSLCATRQQQHCFFGSELDVGKAPAMKQQQQGQPLLSFFDEWPKYTRDSWSDLDQDDRSNHRTSSFSTTQLSISMPVAAASSDFSATSSRSPNGGGGEED